MTCFVRQKKNLKAKEAQANTSESSKASDSGYSGMDSREDPKTSDSARSKVTGNEESRQPGRNNRDMNSNDQVVRQENESQFSARNKASKVASYEEREAKEVKKNLKSEQKSHDGRKSQEGRKPEDDGRSESSDRQV
jgi:hypothetical protein